MPLVRSAGAVFCGPWAPASVGDYVAGPSHVLPTARSARFSSALGTQDFLKRVHVVSLGQEALCRVAPHVAALAHAEGLARARRVGPVPGVALVPARAPARARGEPAPQRLGPSPAPPPRGDLGLREGYHSPQVPVEVRLNTNESPYPPPPEWLEALLSPRPVTSPYNRYPDRSARALREALAELHGVSPDAGFRRQRLERGAPVALPRLRRRRAESGDVGTDLRPPFPHRAPDRHRGGPRRSGGPDFTLEPGAAPSSWTKSSPRSFSCAPRTTRPVWPRTPPPCPR